MTLRRYLTRTLFRLAFPTLYCIIAGLVAAQPVGAKVHRVDNTHNADFSSVADAHTAADGGDTLYVAGSVQSYGSLTLIKPLTIFGPGYFLAQNPQTQANLNSATFATMTFATGSEGSVVSGVTAIDLNVNADDVVVRRNRLTRDLFVSTGRANLIFAQNYVGRNISINGSCSNILILNNLMPNDGNSGSVAINSPSTSSLEVSQNVLTRNITVFNSTVTNNIIQSDDPVVGVTNNNSLVGNLIVAEGDTPESLLLGGDSTDGRWQLAAGSTAIGAGFDGSDQGAFGGLTPYVLSGIPNLPAIFSFTAPAIGSTQSGLQVQLEAKGNN
jgi:hypothetical protein